MLEDIISIIPNVEKIIRIGYSGLNNLLFCKYCLLINKRHDTLNKINIWKNLEKGSLINISLTFVWVSNGVKYKISAETKKIITVVWKITGWSSLNNQAEQDEEQREDYF